MNRHLSDRLRLAALMTVMVVAVMLPAAGDYLLAGTIPPQINYQARLLDNLGDPVNGTVTIRFSINNAAEGGDELWFEEHTGLDVTDGHVELVLGSINPIPDSAFYGAYTYLGVKVGSDPEITPRGRLISVPYAFRTGTLDSASGGTVLGGLVVTEGDSPGTLAVLGNGGDTVLISPSGGQALYATDDNGDLRFSLDITAESASATFFDPVDVKFAAQGQGQRRMSLSSSGITMFGASETDTSIVFRPNGDMVGRGRLVMGQNSVGGGVWSTVLGYGNTASGDSSTVSGGHSNVASGFASVVSGGAVNTASGAASVVGGGTLNVADTAFALVAGGHSNGASGFASVIGGGQYNIVNGNYATVPGGFRNVAEGDYSVAVGNKAKANHDGTVVLAANSSPLTGDSTNSGGPEQMVLRADGGIYITNTGQAATYDTTKLINTRGGAYLSGNGTNWTNSSDRNLKENFTAVDGGEILSKIAQLPVCRWNYKAEGESVSHIGPVAQDFSALFDVGADDKTISTVDPAGIALAAIKELMAENQRLQSRIDELAVKIKELENR